jgi:L,D-peptidoglycan transpeptidase YkuD (ErfK/YbiS/YcfS/YnhG family)
MGSVPVVIGRSGAAWGVGLHPPQPGPRKQEGDGRSPAGVFALGVAFGYANSAKTGLPYEAMDANDYCIDVADSPLYNLVVDAGEVGADAVEGSTEPMRRDLHVGGDQRYKLGFVIQHNPGNEPGLGSCIFAHLWKSAEEATAGCTAMAEPDVERLLAWLTPDANPVFVLLPQEQYDRLRDSWNLPL